MRRDVLELDTALSPHFQRTGLSHHDAEAIRLMLAGNSVVDWQRVAFESMEEVEAFLALHLIDLTRQEDRERLRYVFHEAVDYLEENLQIRIPKDMRAPADIREVFLWASNVSGFRRKQMIACIILKAMHVIAHLEAADLKFRAPLAEETMIDMAQDRVLTAMRRMQDDGLPVVALYGSKKTRSSTITKLLAKKENIAATVFDKLRFRIVVRRREDLIPVLAWLEAHLVPFNYVIPGESHNNLISSQELDEAVAESAQIPAPNDAPAARATSKNEFSGKNYKMINFIADLPVRVEHRPPGAFTFELGQVIYVMTEFQLLDEGTALENERGENAHDLYKLRQVAVVDRRLKRGLRDDERRREANGG